MSFNPSTNFIELLKLPWVQGAAIPVNILLMHARGCIDAIGEQAPIYALHCLAGGVIPLLPALDYALNHIVAITSIVGATKEENIKMLMDYDKLLNGNY